MLIILNSTSFFHRMLSYMAECFQLSEVTPMSLLDRQANEFKYTTAVDGFIEYVQNRLEVTQALKQYALYVSLNLCSLGS